MRLELSNEREESQLEETRKEGGGGSLAADTRLPYMSCLLCGVE